MKKFVLFLMFCMSLVCSLSAQENKHKVKKTSTVPQKIHNVFSRHKHYTGYKSKRERHGIKHKHKVNYKTGEVRNKRSLS